MMLSQCSDKRRKTMRWHFVLLTISLTLAAEDVSDHSIDTGVEESDEVELTTEHDSNIGTSTVVFSADNQDNIAEVSEPSGRSLEDSNQSGFHNSQGFLGGRYVRIPKRWVRRLIHHLDEIQQLASRWHSSLKDLLHDHHSGGQVFPRRAGGSVSEETLLNRLRAALDSFAEEIDEEDIPPAEVPSSSDLIDSEPVTTTTRPRRNHCTRWAEAGYCRCNNDRCILLATYMRLKCSRQCRQVAEVAGVTAESDPVTSTPADHGDTEAVSLTRCRSSLLGDFSPRCAIEGSMMPHPFYCQCYFKCQNGRKRLLACPNGLHANVWALESSRCTTPQNSFCMGIRRQ